MKRRYKVFVSVCLFLCICAASVDAATREYWIAAEKVIWNYAPSGKNLVRPKMGLGVWDKALHKRQFSGFSNTRNPL